MNQLERELEFKRLKGKHPLTYLMTDEEFALFLSEYVHTRGLVSINFV